MGETATRERLIEAAHRSFYRHGFQAVGLDRILADVGVTKTTFYKYFASKDELILAVLRQHDAWWRRTLPELLREHAGDDPAAQLRAVFDVLEAAVERDDYRGCIFHTVTVEFPSPTDPAHLAAAENKRGVDRILAALARRAGVATPEAFAEELGLLVEGMLVVHAVDRSVASARVAKRTAALLFARYLQAPVGAG